MHCIDDLFDLIKINLNSFFEIKVSVMEVYYDKVYDMLGEGGL
jgi:hypothetical protein